MKIQSMTGFGRGEINNNEYNVVVEIKSVNHRFREVRFKMPPTLLSIELDLRKKLFEYFKRGNFEVYVHYRRNKERNIIDDLDKNKVREFLQEMKQLISETEQNLYIGPCDFFRNEFIKDDEEDKIELLKNTIQDTFLLALKNLDESRNIEGKKLLTNIKEHKKNYLAFFQKIRKLSDLYQQQIENKLKKKFKEFDSEIKVDEGRFLQEIVYYLEKLDVHEEINRIDSHLSRLDDFLSLGGEIGRQIDFMIQELNRETNTIGSKSGQGEISELVVQMKVQLEKIREQGLNLE